MKKLVLIFSIVLCLSGCNTKNNINEKEGVAIYYNKNNTWAATVTLIDSGDSIFESLYIQNIEDRNLKTSPIEYTLEGNDMKSESQYPQKLQGVRSFQVSTEINKQLFRRAKLDSQYKLTIISQGGKSEMNLKLIDEEGNF